MFKRWRDKKKENEQVRLASSPGKLAILFCIPPLPLALLMRVLELLGGWGSRDDFLWHGWVDFLKSLNKMVFSLRDNFVGTLI